MIAERQAGDCVARVGALSISPVKGTRVTRVQRIELGPQGVRANRRFYLIDEQDRMVNAKSLGELQQIVSRYDDGSRRLELEFPGGRCVSAPVTLGEPVTTRFFSGRAAARHVLGDFSAAISSHLGKPLRLVEAGAEGAVDRGARGPVSLISRASLRRLAREGALEDLDARRFRMLIEIDGVAAHDEDGWLGREVSLGQAAIRLTGHVGRCLITSRDPDSGEVDLPTLDLLAGYRRRLHTTEPLPFGVFGEVVRPGVISLGDPVGIP